MKYVLMYTSNAELMAAVPPERQQEVYTALYHWFVEHAESFPDSGAELQAPETATTLRHSDSGPVVIDGPFSEAKESIGGFSILEAPDLDAAIALVKTWPQLQLPGCSVEIRPMVVDYTQFDDSTTDSTAD